MFSRQNVGDINMFIEVHSVWLFSLIHFAVVALVTDMIVSMIYFNNMGIKHSNTKDKTFDKNMICEYELLD